MTPLLLAVAVAATPVTVPPQPELTRQIEAADADLFKTFSEGSCDLPRFRAMLAEDIEFYHDKGGFNVRNADEFTKQYAERCKAQDDTASWRSRRELVRSSLRVDPIPGWGAMEVGDHLFYEKHGAAGTEKLVGKASFAMVWTLGADGKWRLSRVLSFAHAPAGDAVTK